MAFTPPKQLPEFADLKSVLVQSKDTDSPLYQVVQELIDRLSRLKSGIGETAVPFQIPFSGLSTGGGGGGTDGTGGGNTTATYITDQDETATLPNSFELVTRYGLVSNTLTANKKIVDLDLEYLGAFSPGPLYSDGDVVIGSDNIAYLCVRATSNPPVTWPGVGIATAVGPPGPQGPPGVDTGVPNATYWVVTPDVKLVNARAMSTLGTGYVRSTVGEPSVVATIPLTDTTGILPDNRLTSNVALKNIDNAFVAQTFATSSRFSGPNSLVYYVDTSGGVDKKVWRTLSYGDGNFYLESWNDAISAALGQFLFTRNGYVSTVGFIGNGANLTNLNGPSITTGLVNPARLGSGTADATTFLRGDSTWQPVGAAFPSGLIVISVTPCPPGWNRITVWDGYMLRGGPNPGTTGGSDTHSHTLGNLQTNAHSHGGQTGAVTISGQTDAQGNHTHSFTTDQNQSIVGLGSGAGSAQAAYGFHQHTGATDAGGNHAHNFSGSGVGSITAEAVAIVGGMDAASNLPHYVNVFFCQKA